MCLKFYLAVGLISLTLLPNEVFAGQLFPAGEPEHLCQSVVNAYTVCDSDLSYPEPHKLVSVGKKALPCTDGKKLDFYTRRENMDLASMLSIPYQAGIIEVPEKRAGHDPGRLRNEDFFKALYGISEAKVKANLVQAEFLGQKVLFNKRQGAAKALEATGKELLQLMEHDSELKEYLTPWLSGKLEFNGSSGHGSSTFLWRDIAGTDRLSDHSFGVAIDVFNPKLRAPYYWLWELDKKSSNTKSDPPTREQEAGSYVPTKMVKVPWSLVQAFEKFGFIWGGKWNHFDAMHFEFRPEFFPGLKRSCE